ncbi:MAG: tRNA (N6-isopentenyl adenosine(37)-C2)-methylthiotransferase MiaB [Candidatus Aminicenantes bacterium]|nr:tRNA (N6-isopentenyl adenosine(37)-C2)-methylthiotransferase MiaB [Candidatus Aminicenantes bacterium]
MKFFIHTFGCQMNENDSEHIAGLLAASGYQQANTIEESDVVIVNTCAVRQKSEDKLYSLLGRLGTLKKTKNLTIGVAGCVAQLQRSNLFDKNPFIDFILGPDNYWQISRIISSCNTDKFIATHWHNEWKEIPHIQTLRENFTSAYVTIMEGCNNFCSFCIVPFTRGREKYRPMNHILNEIKSLAQQGYKEIQLLGQNVNSYKAPKTGKDFVSLLKEVDRIDSIQWIRFITSHPKNFTKEISAAMKDSEKVCRQLHLPVQSGSTSVLQRMKRGYSRVEYLQIIEILRDLMPDICLSTDIIVGFPGETDKDFQETISLLQTVRFTNLFSFRYSPRPYTAASRMKDSIPLETKKKRLIELQSIQKELQLKMNQSLIGQTMKVLCTGQSKKDPKIFSGRNEGYQVINFRSEKDVIGKFVKVRILSCGPYSLQGVVIQ